MGKAAAKKHARHQRQQNQSGSAEGDCHKWIHTGMDNATRRHWEQIADRCFDRAYRVVLRQVTPKPANGQVPGPRATD